MFWAARLTRENYRDFIHLRFEDESAEELYEMAPCGYLSTALDGRIIRANQTLKDWVGYPLRKDFVTPDYYNGMPVPLVFEDPQGEAEKGEHTA